MTFLWKSVEQYFTVVLFFFFNFVHFVILENLDLALSGVKRFIHANLVACLFLFDATCRFCVNQCSNPGYCAAQALRQDIITLPQGVPANNIVARLVPFFPPYMASMRYYCEFQYSFSVNPSPFAIRMLGSELVVYTKETLSRAAMHQMQVTANLFYMDGRLACRTVFTVYIDVAKFSF